MPRECCEFVNRKQLIIFFVKNMLNVCRLCMRETTSPELLQPLRPFRGIIRSLTQVDVGDFEDLPQKCCQACISLLITANMMRINVRETHQQWMDLLARKGAESERLPDPEAPEKPQCRLCLKETRSMAADVFDLDLPEGLLALRVYDSPEVPLKVCRMCLNQAISARKIVESCQNVQVDPQNEDQCLLCAAECHPGEFQNPLYLKNFAHLLSNQEIVGPEVFRRRKFCQSCVRSLQSTCELRFQSHRIEAALLVQYGDLEKQYEVEFLEDEFEEFLPPPPWNSAPDPLSDSEDDFDTLQLNSPTPQKLFTCLICQSVFVSDSLLLLHDELEHKTFGDVCEMCGLRVKHTRQLRQHKMRVHYKVVDHVCEVCGKAFAEKANFELHLTTHRTEKTVGCEVCGAKFGHKKGLSLHMRKHTGQKPYPCRYCARRFAHPTDRKRHECTHTKEYLYKCSVCSKGFSKKTLLKTHEANHPSRLINTLEVALEEEV